MATASVIVRARDRAHTIERALRSLRRQTVVPEIIVVDSGSRDDTVRLARALCDRLIEIPPEWFTFGRGLNLGAEAASGNVHCALSAHCFVPREDWIERAVAHFDRPDVAGVCGYGGNAPEGVPPGVVHQDIELLRRDPFWGFTNHASAWRASVWEQFRFDDQLAGAEDKEWSLRVLQAGHVIALDPALDVSTAHRFENGLADFYRRNRRDTTALAEVSDLQPYPFGELVARWWRPEPDGVRSTARQRLSPWHITGLLGRQAGLRDASERR